MIRSHHTESEIERGARPPGLPLWAHAADAAVIVLLLLAAYVAIEGGVVLRSDGPRLSVRSEWRVLLWAGALLIARHLLIRQSPLHRRIIDRVSAAARAPGQFPADAVQPAPGAPRPVGPRRILAYSITVVLVYAAFTAIMTYPQVRHLDTGISGDIGDPLLSTWRLSWIAHQLPRDPLNLFNGNIFHPERRTLAYSDAMLVPSLMVAPLVWLGVHQLLAYNLLFLSGFVLSGAGMFLLVRSLTRHTGAALVAGFVFAFLPYRFDHYSHLELQMAQWMPFCLWALHRTVREGRLRDGLLTGLFFALQTLSSLYYGIFFATYLIPVGTALLLGAGIERARRAIRPLAAGAVLSAVLVAPFAMPYLTARHSVGERPVWEVEFYSATPQNYLAAPPANIAFGHLTHEWGGSERHLFQGFTVLLIALAGLWPPLSAARIGYALGLLLAFEISLGYNGILYPWLHAYLLPYRGLRVPARVAIIVGLSLAILAGYGVARLCGRWRNRWAGLAASLILIVPILLEYRHTVGLRHIWSSPPAIYDVFRDQPASVIAEFPFIEPDIAVDPIFMYFSTFHWQKLVNGYSGFGPESYFHLREMMTTFPDDDSVAELQRRGVDFVVVHGYFYPPEAYDELVSRLESRQDFASVARSRWEGRETRLYRLLKSPPTP